jgi:asparagine synthetase B (glutamine-hydrolysing)
LKSAVNYLFEKHYIKSLVSNKDKIKKRIRKSIKEMYCDSEKHENLGVEEYINFIEAWNIINRQAKFIVNSVRTYEFLGYEWRIPLWDNELTDFWLRQSLSNRINSKLYNKYLINLFKKYRVDFRKKKKNSYFLNFKHFLKRITPAKLVGRYRNKQDQFNILNPLKDFLRKKEIKKEELLKEKFNYYLAKLQFENFKNDFLKE